MKTTLTNLIVNQTYTTSVSMESSLLNDPSPSPSNQIKKSKRKTYHRNHHQQHQHQAARLPNISRQSSCGTSVKLHQKLAPPPPPPHVQLEMVHAATGGVFLNHFSSNNNNQFHLSTSLPPILPSQHHYHHQQPPLLPLPVVSKPTFHSLPSLTRRPSLSSPIPRKQTNQKVVKSPAAPTNNKRSTTNNTHQKSKKENTCNNNNGSLLLAEDNEIVESTKDVGPDPVSYPKEVTRVKMMADLKKEGGDDDMIDNKFIAPSVVFCLSPPPSSLPLPKFSLRQVQQNKISCKAEAAVDEVDAGAATDNLCRLLKLR